MVWSEELLKEKNAIKLRKFICCKCGFLNPMMELINTINCLQCGYMSSLVENGYVILDNENFSVLEISNNDDEFILVSESDLLLINDFENYRVSSLYGYRLKEDISFLSGEELKEAALKELDKLFDNLGSDKMEDD